MRQRGVSRQAFAKTRRGFSAGLIDALNQRLLACAAPWIDILAGELKKQPTHTAAFESYEKLMRPYVASGRTVRPGVIRLFIPSRVLESE